MNPLEQHRYRLVHNMPLEAEVLLSLIAEHGPLNIMEAIELAEREELASFSTIHKYLTILRSRELLVELVYADDHRTISLDVSAKGIRYLKGLQ